MRIQLHSKRVQTSLREAFLQAFEPQLTRKVVIVITIRLPRAQYEPVNEPVPEKQSSQRIEKNPDTKHATPFVTTEGGTHRSQKVNVYTRRQQARKKMRQKSSGKLLAGNRDLPVRPKDERCDDAPGPPERQGKK